MVLSEYLRFCFPSLQRRGSDIGARLPPKALLHSCIHDLRALSATGSTIAIPRCSEEHGGTVGPSTVFLAMQVRVGEDHECNNEGGGKAMKCPSPKDVWRYGGWLLPNTNMVPSVKDEKAALEGGAVKFDLDLKGVMQVERKSSDRHTEARMVDFLKKFPRPRPSI